MLDVLAIVLTDFKEKQVTYWTLKPNMLNCTFIFGINLVKCLILLNKQADHWLFLGAFLWCSWSEIKFFFDLTFIQVHVSFTENCLMITSITYHPSILSLCSVWMCGGLPDTDKINVKHRILVNMLKLSTGQLYSFSFCMIQLDL